MMHSVLLPIYSLFLHFPQFNTKNKESNQAFSAISVSDQVKSLFKVRNTFAFEA